MKKNRKNSKTHVEDIKRYLNDEMAAGERNAFERKLESDTFLAEAVEGYAHIDDGEAAEDIDALQKRIKSRTKRKSTLVYRVAAAIVALLVVSSVLLVNNLRQSGQQIAENRELKVDESPEQPVDEPSESKSVSTLDTTPGREELRETELEKPLAGLIDSGKKIVIEHEIEPVVQEADKIDDAVELTEMVLADKAAKGEVIKEEAPVGVVTAEQETSKKGAGVKEVVARQVADIELSRDARPLIDLEEFREYLAEEQVYPSAYTHLGRVTVKIELIIKADGRKGEIRVLESPAKAFSDEVTRLIREGPEWLPALKDGKAVRDTVKLELIFSGRRD
ncbi:MAG: energy transducer TonB [Bacteroidales bacterium]|nr:energy transducer TonB [Bacteroidales bacterium]